MTLRLGGLHHVTAVAANGQANVVFYTGVLGLRLVKRTVNFAAPDTYHLYYGDAAGRPGTILSFFLAPDRGQARQGSGQAIAVAFAAPPDSLAYWVDRLAQFRVPFARSLTCVDEPALTFRDPDGLALDLVAADVPSQAGAAEHGPVPPEHAIRGLHSVTLALEDPGATCRFLGDTLGCVESGSNQHVRRFTCAGSGLGAAVYVAADSRGRGTIGAGAVHHVAFRARDTEDHPAWRARLEAAGADPTDVIDRVYFRSIYFHEPGGVRLEITVDPPGFCIDEAPHELGMNLRLPPWLESRRAELEAVLPCLDVGHLRGAAWPLTDAATRALADRAAVEVRLVISNHVGTDAAGDLQDELPLGPLGLGLDSVGIVELLLACEERFGFPFPPALFDDGGLTVGRLIEYVRRVSRA